MYRFCRLPLAFDPMRLRAALEAAVASPWLPHHVTGNYVGDWSAIPLRTVGGRTDHAYAEATAAPEAFANTPILACADYLREVLESFHCPVTTARLLKLGAGSLIKEHRDHDLSVDDGIARLHIPIATHPLVEFFVEEERVVMGEGECWYIDATLPHRLANRSPVDRVHLVFDCVVNDWLRVRLDEAGYRPRERDPFERRGVRKADAEAVIAALRAMGSPMGQRLAGELAAAKAALEEAGE